MHHLISVLHALTLADINKLITSIRINSTYQVPYLAGYSIDGKTIYIDKRLPRKLILKDGRIINIFKYLVVHEVYEKYLEDTMDYKYAYAHELATGKEREAVEKDGIDWDEYQGYMLKMVKKLKKFSEPIPLDLDTKPEKDSHDYYRYHKIKDIQRREKYDISNTMPR